MIARLRLAALFAAALLAGQIVAAQAQNTGAVVTAVPGIIRVPESGGPAPNVSPIRIRPEAPTPGNGPPLYGRDQPLVTAPSALPYAASGGLNPCPNGYIPAPGVRLPHTLVCIVGQQLANARSRNVATQNTQSSNLGLNGLPLSASSLAPSIESAGINQCAHRPGFYACGRGGTECCGPFQDNLCFPGAYACSISGTIGGGARQACCMSR